MTEKKTASRAKCPVCGKPTDRRYRPFCSSRCADVDLGRWLGETYRVPGDEVPTAAGTGAGEEDDF